MKHLLTKPRMIEMLAKHGFSHSALRQQPAKTIRRCLEQVLFRRGFTICPFCDDEIIPSQLNACDRCEALMEVGP